MRHRTAFNPESFRELSEFGVFFHDRRQAKTERERSQLTFVDLLNRGLQSTANRYLSGPLGTTLYDLKGVLSYVDNPSDIYRIWQEDHDEEISRYAETLFDVLINLDKAPTIDGYRVEENGFSDPVMVQLPTGRDLAECLASGNLFFCADRCEATGPFVLFATTESLVFGEIMLPKDQ
jgi:hypothetical protein